MASYDTTIKRLARQKTSLSPSRLIAEQQVLNADLRDLNRKKNETKSMVEYKASQLVRSQDRIRQSTLSSHYKQFSKLSRDADRTASQEHLLVNRIQSYCGKAKVLRNSKHSNTNGSRSLSGTQSLEMIVEHTKNNRKILERSSYNSKSNAPRSLLQLDKSQLNSSQMSLTEFYMSRSQVDLRKIKKKTYKN